MTNPGNRHAKLEMPSDRELIITRDFKAPRELLFETLTKPEHVKRWYGLRSLELPICEIDFRPGGKWRYVMHDPSSGADHAFSGEYRAIVRPDKIVATERYEAIPNSDYVVTTTLTEHQGRTTLRSHLVYQTKEHRDGHIMSGMEKGMNETHDRLDELLERLQTA